MKKTEIKERSYGEFLLDFIIILTGTLLYLKLNGAINISWACVFGPLIAYIVGFAVALLVCLIMAVIFIKFTER